MMTPGAPWCGGSPCAAASRSSVSPVSAPTGRAPSAAQLDPVVLGRVVAGRDHRARHVQAAAGVVQHVGRAEAALDHVGALGRGAPGERLGQRARTRCACRARSRRWGAGQPDERGTHRLGDLLVELVGDDPADVVRLEDLRRRSPLRLCLPYLAGNHARRGRASAYRLAARPHCRGQRRPCAWLMRRWDIRAKYFAGTPAVRPIGWPPGARRPSLPACAGPEGRSYLSRSRASGEERSTRRCPRLPTSTPWPTGSPGGGQGRLPYRVGQRLQVIGLRWRGLHREPHDFPAARHGQPVGVRRAQVVAVRLDVRGQRAEDRGGVAVHVGQRVDRELLAGGPGAAAGGHLHRPRGRAGPGRGVPARPEGRGVAYIAHNG